MEIGKITFHYLSILYCKKIHLNDKLEWNKMYNTYVPVPVMLVSLVNKF